MAAVNLEEAQSPAEERFWSALMRAHSWAPGHNRVGERFGLRIMSAIVQGIGLVTVLPQAPIDGYKVDFLFLTKRLEVAVELDGFEFHDRTPEQALRDRLKDRRLLRRWVLTMRFTGHEVMFDADRCVAETIETLKLIKNIYT